MLDLSRPLDCEHCLQHLIRPFDAVYPASNAHPSPASLKEEAHSLHRFLHGHLRYHLRSPFQVLQLQSTLWCGLGKDHFNAPFLEHIC